MKYCGYYFLITRKNFLISCDILLNVLKYIKRRIKSWEERKKMNILTRIHQEEQEVIAVMFLKAAELVEVRILIAPIHVRYLTTNIAKFTSLITE